MEEQASDLVGDYSSTEEFLVEELEKIYIGEPSLRYGAYILKDLENQEAGKEESEVLKRLTSLHHINLVKYDNFLQDQARSLRNPVTEIEYCPGGSLFDEIQTCKKNKEAFPEIQIISWLIQIVNGLEAIHSQNIIHLDINPKNILIGEKGIIKIDGFGISKILNSSDDTIIQLKGTLPYVSPEALQGKMVTKKSDIWSLGVLAYELCYLNLPYKGKSVSQMKTLLQNKYYAPPMQKNYSKNFLKLIKSMLQKKPVDRPRLKKLKKELQMVKAINLCSLINKYQDVGYEKRKLINLVQNITSPYCLRLFLNHKLEGLFDLEHCYHRMLNGKEEVTYVTFEKDGSQTEISYDMNITILKILNVDGSIIEKKNERFSGLNEEPSFLRPNKKHNILHENKTFGLPKDNAKPNIMNKKEIPIKQFGCGSIFENSSINSVNEERDETGDRFHEEEEKKHSAYEEKFTGQYNEKINYGYNLNNYDWGKTFEGVDQTDLRNEYGSLLDEDGFGSEGEFEYFQQNEQEISCFNIKNIDKEKFNYKTMTYYGRHYDIFGNTFEGYFKDFKLQGHVILYNSNGLVIDGEFKDNKSIFHEIYYYPNGDIMEGVFKDNAMNGHIKWILANGNRFEGELKNNKKYGYIFDSDQYSLFEGEIKDDKITGHGIIYYNDGYVFDGEFKNGICDGHGIEYFYDGPIFEGEYKDGQINGYGMYNFNNGDIYEGEFKNNKKNGYGIYHFNNGDIYEGEYLNNERNGYGIYYSIDGIIVEGEYKDDNKNGHGIEYCRCGKIQEFEFTNNIENGNYEVFLPNEGIIKGQMKNGKNNGYAVFYSKYGNAYEVEFIEDFVI